MSDKIKAIGSKISAFFKLVATKIALFFSGVATKLSELSKGDGKLSKVITPSNAIMAIHVIACVTVILVGHYALGFPLVSVCILVVLETLFAALLGPIPVWVHGLILVAQIVVGLLADRIILMALMDVIYVVAVAVLFLLPRFDRSRARRNR